MKTFVLYICVFSLICYTSARFDLEASLRSNRKLLTKQGLNECINKTNITHDEMFNIVDILIDKYKEPGKEESVRKHGYIFHCTLQKNGVMEGSEVIVDKLYNEVNKRIPEQLKGKVTKIVNNCIVATKTIREKYQKTFDLVMCLLKTKFKNLQQLHTVNEEPTHKEEHIYENTYEDK